MYAMEFYNIGMTSSSPDSAAARAEGRPWTEPGRLAKVTTQLVLDAADLRERMVAAAGSEGAAWFDALPATVGAAAERFGISALGPLRPGTQSFVVEAETATGVPAVLKLVLPSRDTAFELEVLVRARGRGYVGVLGAEPDLGTVLLERLPPGPDFYDAGPDGDETAARAVARCIQGKWRGGPEDVAHFPTVATWAADFDRVWATAASKPPLGYTQAEIATARNDFMELLGRADEISVLHGDLHHANVLLDSVGRPIAIDPKGVTGPLAYEVGAFMRNPGPALTTWPAPVATLLRRAEIFADELAIEPALTLRWGVVQLALSAVWAATDGDRAWSRYVAELKPLMAAAADAAS